MGGFSGGRHPRIDVADEEVTGKRGKLMRKVDQCSAGHCRYSSFSCGYGTGMDWIKLYRPSERDTHSANMLLMDTFFFSGGGLPVV